MTLIRCTGRAGHQENCKEHVIEIESCVSLGCAASAAAPFAAAASVAGLVHAWSAAGVDALRPLRGMPGSHQAALRGVELITA